MRTIVWFRQDLRTSDNPALSAAAARGAVVPVFILDEETAAERRLGGASGWWLHHSLAALSDDLGDLVLCKGEPREILPAMVRDLGANAVYWNRCYEPYAIACDKEFKASMQKLGIEAQSFNGNLLHEPWEIATRAGSPFRVYTPYWRGSLAKPVATPLSAPRLKLEVPDAYGDRLDDWQLRPTRPNWAAGWDKFWKPGEAGALACLDAFIRDGLRDYEKLRDRPDLRGTSRLSPASGPRDA